MVEGKGVGDFHDGSGVKNLSRIHLSMQEVWVQSLPQRDSLQREIATHPSILSWKILWTEESSRLQSMGSQRLTHLATKQHMEVSGVWGRMDICPKADSPQLTISGQELL